MNIGRITLSSNILNQYMDHFAELAVNAIYRLKGNNDLDFKG